MPQVGGFGEPAGDFSADQFSKRFNVVSAVVKTGDIGETLTTCVAKDISILLSNLFKCFQAVDRESRTDHVHVLDALLGQRTQGFIRIGA